MTKLVSRIAIPVVALLVGLIVGLNIVGTQEIKLSSGMQERRDSWAERTVTWCRSPLPTGSVPSVSACREIPGYVRVSPELSADGIQWTNPDGQVITSPYSKTSTCGDVPVPAAWRAVYLTVNSPVPVYNGTEAETVPETLTSERVQTNLQLGTSGCALVPVESWLWNVDEQVEVDSPNVVVEWPR